MRVRMMTYVETDDEPTRPGLSRYLSHEEPTTEVRFDKSDALYESRERLRSGETEAAGFWLLMASGLNEGGG